MSFGKSSLVRDYEKRGDVATGKPRARRAGMSAGWQTGSLLQGWLFKTKGSVCCWMSLGSLLRHSCHIEAGS